MKPRETRPYWPSVTDEVLADEARLARVLVDMGFGKSSGGMVLHRTTRGAIAWWQPDYQAGKWASHFGLDRVAALNRAMRDAAVLVLARAVEPAWRSYPNGGRFLMTHEGYVLDTRSGEWRSDNGAQFGADLITLGMLLWGCRYGQAGARIARVAGFRVPVIPTQSRGLFHAA